MAAAYSTTEREAVKNWFETDFRESAMRTTRTSRLEDGKVSYSFSVTNDSGLSFGSFAFRVKILNKADGSEIGSARINAGAWNEGETKNFKSRISIPADVKSISFVMYSESIEYDILQNGYGDPVTDAIRDIGSVLTGESTDGGMLGELFGTGGMPKSGTDPHSQSGHIGMQQGSVRTGTVNAGRRSGAAGAGRASQSAGTGRQAGTAGAGRSSSGGYNYQPRTTYARRKLEKKLNKQRLGKSGWTVFWAVMGVLFGMAAIGTTGVGTEVIAYAIICLGCIGAAAGLKYFNNLKAKRIRIYEATVNRNGNTSIDELAAQAGRPPEKVADDLQKMIVGGFFPEAYVDIPNGLVVMTRNGEPIESVERSAAMNKKARRKAAREQGLLPSDIDDLITMTDDAQLKNKLKGLRTITRRIDTRVEQRPELADQVKEFREKYYPGVVRLTDEYNEKIADLDREASVKEPNTAEINASPNYLQEQARTIKEQLIRLIDSVTEASENLLEKLHEDDIMDITADIQSLQTVLSSRGLLDSDFDIKL